MKPRIDDKNQQAFLKEAIQIFYNSAPDSGWNSEMFVRAIKEKVKGNAFEGLLGQFEILSDEDTYGTIKFILKAEPSDIVYRFKRPDAYDGPKKEYYIDRIQSMHEAALEIAGTEQKQKLTDHFERFKKRIEKDVKFQTNLLQHLDRRHEDYEKAIENFEEQHALAKIILAEYTETLVDMISQSTSEKLSNKKIKKKLKATEDEIKSNKRPELITIYQQTLAEENTPHIVANISKPVDKERTASSAKKDEPGIANWMSTQNIYYQKKDNKFEQVADTGESYRSASIIPHEIVGDKIGRILAQQITANNVQKGIIPALLEKKINKENQLKAGSKDNPIILDYNLLTLISPISVLLDKTGKIDPDAFQFIFMRDAINQYDGRIFCINHKGKNYHVKLNAIYENYGANVSRGWSRMEKRTANIKAYNKHIDASIKTLSKDESIQQHLKQIPQFTEKEQDTIKKIRVELNYAYDKLESLYNDFDHENFSKLRNKLKYGDGLTHAELEKYLNLSDDIQDQRTSYTDWKTHIRKNEKKIEALNRSLAKRRESFFRNNNRFFNQLLDVNIPPATKTHIAYLNNYITLSRKGYDSIFTRNFKNIIEANKLNYEIQTCIHHLDELNEIEFHKTCKSGKDRTNAAECQKVAKDVLRHLVPQIIDPDNNQQEPHRVAFVNHYQHGSGNYIAGLNAAPGAQQVSSGDLSIHYDVSPMKKISSLQKGVYKLKVPETKKKIKIKSTSQSLRKNHATQVHSDTQRNKQKKQSPTTWSHTKSPVQNKKHSEKICRINPLSLRDLKKNIELNKDKYKIKEYNFTDTSANVTFDINQKKRNASATKKDESLVFSIENNNDFNSPESREAIQRMCEIAILTSQNSEFTLTEGLNKEQRLIIEEAFKKAVTEIQRTKPDHPCPKLKTASKNLSAHRKQGT